MTDPANDPVPDPNLAKAVKTCLEEKGTLGKIQCQIRSDIVSALKSSDNAPAATFDLPAKDREPLLSADNFILNELIREYLDWNGYVHARDVLRVESGQPKIGLERDELERSLGLECGRNAAKVPLLYAIVADLKRRKN